MRDLKFTVDQAIKIEVYNDDKGIFQFSEDTRGKTWLCKVLKEYHTMGLPVAGYTFNDFDIGAKISFFLGKGLKLLEIDRYGMFNGEMAEDIIKLSQDCLVLIDCKNEINIPAMIKYKSLELEDNKIIIV